MNYYDKNMILIGPVDLNKPPVKIEFDKPFFCISGTQEEGLILEKIIIEDNVIYPNTSSMEVPIISTYTINDD